MKLNLQKTLIVLTLFVTGLVLVTACKKNSSTPSTTNYNGNAANMSANGAISDNAFDDAFGIALQTGNAYSLTSLTQQKNGAATMGFNVASAYYCANITVKPTPNTIFPDTLIVDFGSGCTSVDNITRSGSITYIFSGHISYPGTVISANFDNYVVNGYKLGGTYSITNTSSNTSFALTTAVTDGNITYPNDTSYSFTGSKTVALVSGSIATPSTLVFNITGGYGIGSSYGDTLTATVTSPLERKESCAYVDKGVVSFKYTKNNTSLNGTLDYGDGTCDSTALITIGNYTQTVTLP